MAARLVLALCLGAAVASGLTCCGSGGRGAKLGERVIPLGQPVPKGGGVYRVGEPYEIAGTWYYPREEKSYNRVGKASWYGELFHGRRTANGEIYDMDRLSAAHPTLPLPSYARVTNLNNGRSVVVRVNDRGPCQRPHHRSVAPLGDVPASRQQRRRPYGAFCARRSVAMIPTSGAISQARASRRSPRRASRSGLQSRAS
jgi:hypothetical protein